MKERINLKDMYKKLFSSTELNLKVKIDGVDTNIIIPATGHVVVSESVGNYVNVHYPSVEVAEATLEDYQAYRKSKEKAETIQAEAQSHKIKAEKEEAKAEAKRVEAKLGAQEVHKEQLATAEKEHLAKVAQDEKDVIKSLGGIIKEDVTQVTPVVEPKKSGRKSKK